MKARLRLSTLDLFALSGYIKSVRIRPLYPHAALLLEDDKRYVAVTDLHIGIEYELIERGVTLPSLASKMGTDLLGLVKKQNADGVILLGDIKHTVGSISKQEWEEIPALLKQLAARVDVYLIPGNHDSNIRHLVPSGVNAVTAKGMFLCDTLLLHGHSLPSNIRAGVERVVMGHLHPVFLMKDSVINGERVWIYVKGKKQALFPSERGALEIVVMPSFNPHLYATGVRYHRSISPILTRVLKAGVSRCFVATLDGSVVGDEDTLSEIL
jgi:uncharacterized protein